MMAYNVSEAHQKTWIASSFEIKMNREILGGQTSPEKKQRINSTIEAEIIAWSWSWSWNWSEKISMSEQKINFFVFK